ncbi:hypothetical protein [Caballeronia sp. LZ032]|uniref:hypothetical protein n=1 Tax=Caballeronia sp. LZ032 TaxID=3038565 RepID=UPI0028632EE8|nr:hypothetical protein [Caballeronia sp. LZ032]MDR5880923.1 hypothetical protein [Caballeronia sp. LZ032]
MVHKRRGGAMIRSYNHKGFVLEVAVQANGRIVPVPVTAHYLAIVTISRSGRPVTAFSPLRVESERFQTFASAEDALMSGHTAARAMIDEWTEAAG